MLNRNNYRGVAASLCLSFVMLSLAFPALATAADENAKEQERVTESGNVMKDLVNSSNGVPTGLLNKAECVIVLPSVKKAAFVVGASYGRGVMTCRTGKNFDGPWSAPSSLALLLELAVGCE
jgi:SH3 domain-containing YSC84-like protein 1